MIMQDDNDASDDTTVHLHVMSELLGQISQKHILHKNNFPWIHVIP